MLKTIIEGGWHIRVLWSLVVVVAGILLYKGIMRLIRTGDKMSGAAGRTANRIAGSIIRSIFVILIPVLVMEIMGLNVSSILAGLGLIGIVIGFAIQDWLKDIIRGFTILGDEYFKVGDVVVYQGREGEVVTMGILTTKIRFLDNSNIISVSNRKLEEAEVMSHVLKFKVPMPHDLPVYEAEKVMEDVVRRVRKNEGIENVIYKGVKEIHENRICYDLETEANPLNAYQTRRDTNRSILLALEANHVEVPFPQLDLHTVDPEERERHNREISELPGMQASVARSQGEKNDSVLRKERITIEGRGLLAEDALERADEFIERVRLTSAEGLQLRLVVEELMELVTNNAVKPFIRLDFASEGRKCIITMDIRAVIEGRLKEELMLLSTVEQEKKDMGLMERIKSAAEHYLSDEGKKTRSAKFRDYEWEITDGNIPGDEEEFGRSIIANIADEVMVGSGDGYTRVQITKDF